MVPTVHVGCVTYNSLEYLPECLDSLQNQTYSHIQIHIADNNSKDNSVEWLQSQIGMHLHELPQNIGFARAHNYLIKHSNLLEQDYYMALNPDVILDEQYIEKLVDVLSQNKEVGWCTGKLFLLDNPSHLYSAGHAIRRDGYFVNIGYGLKDTPEFYPSKTIFGAPAAASMYRSKFIEDISINNQFFDERFFLYSEDTDVDWRGQLAGWTCWLVPEAKALHKGGEPVARNANLAIANRYLSVLKNAFLYDLILYNLPLIISHLLLRVLFTPREGSIMLYHFVRHSMTSLRRRKSPAVERAYITSWFTQNVYGMYPITLKERIQSFFSL